MRITSLKQQKFGFSARIMKEAWAKKLVLRLLERLSTGCLIIEDDGQQYHFGEDRQHAEVVAQIRINDPRAWQSVLQGGTVAAGEAYMHGYWDSPDLVKVVRVMVRNMSLLQDIEAKQSVAGKLASRMFHYLRRNSQGRAQENIAAHYDLSNEFFSLFLDKTMAYSAGIFFSENDTLEQASVNKFDHICRRLQLRPEDHLLEIGTGWGGLAIHAARHYGCRVTTTTLSKEQLAWAQDWVRREGLEDRITLLLKDYRDLEGQFDKLVSVEMIEAVGAEYYDSYFRQCNALLKADGLMLIQAITISDQRYDYSVTNVDFIKRYIFPGGQLPSNTVVLNQLTRNTDMQLVGLEDITHDYARTLRAWRDNFWAHIDKVKAQGADDVFIRMWHYYLCFCEGGFMERVIHTAQFLTAKPQFKTLPLIKR